MDDIKELKSIKAKRYINRAAQAGKGMIKMGLGTCNATSTSYGSTVL